MPGRRTGIVAKGSRIAESAVQRSASCAAGAAMKVAGEGTRSAGLALALALRTVPVLSKSGVRGRRHGIADEISFTGKNGIQRSAAWAAGDGKQSESCVSARN